MLSAKGLLDALLQENVSAENTDTSDNDLEFNELLISLGYTVGTDGCTLRCSDGQERSFSLDSN